MKKYCLVIFLTLFGLLSPHSIADSPPALAVPPGLSLAEIKITGNEYVLLQNNSNTAIADLSRYWLYDFNNFNPLAAGVSSSTQQLPAAALGAGQTISLSANGGMTCGAAVTAKLSVSLTDSSGFLEVVQTNLVNGVLQQGAGDAVSWSSSSSTSAIITGVPSNSSDVNGTHAYYRYQSVALPPTYGWKLADMDLSNPCQLLVAGAVAPGSSSPGNQLSAGLPPPVIFAAADTQASPGGTGASLPAADVGLSAPVLNEILPNPAEPQSDDEDEFIELYNSNDTAFDLSGFKLQVGTSTLHTYTFPEGTTLAAKSFTAFYSIDTNLSMSNSGGQAKLLDPFGNSLSQSDVYDSAKDAQAWALGNGKWYWTTTATPGAVNVITDPAGTKLGTIATIAKKPSTSGSSKPASTAKVKAASTSKPSSTNPGSSAATAAAKIHPFVLAVIGAAAVAYAAYEYRHDMANRLYQLRRHRASRRTIG